MNLQTPVKLLDPAKPALCPFSRRTGILHEMGQMLSTCPACEAWHEIHQVQMVAPIPVVRRVPDPPPNERFVTDWT